MASATLHATQVISVSFLTVPKDSNAISILKLEGQILSQWWVDKRIFCKISRPEIFHRFTQKMKFFCFFFFSRPSYLIPQPSSLIPHSSSLILHTSALSPQPSYFTHHTLSLNLLPAYLIPHSSSLILHPLSFYLIPHPSNNSLQPSALMPHTLNFIPYLSSRIPHPAFLSCYSSSLILPPLSFIPHL